MYKGVIFDLDGVIVDTAKYHFLAWKRLAKELDIEFTKEDNERLKGVSRMRSLEIILEIGNKSLLNEEKHELASKKNEWYVDYLQEMDQSEILEGVKDLLKTLKEKKVPMALGSASKNAPFILEKLELTDYFTAIVDGNSISKAKPNPEVFLHAADALSLKADDCIVVEDAKAGVEAAKNAKMFAIGIGKEEQLGDANIIIKDTSLLKEIILKYII